MSRTLTIHTDDLLDNALRERAQSDGKTIPEMAREILNRALVNRPQAGSRRREEPAAAPEQQLPPLSSREREHAWRRSNRELLLDQYAKQWVVLEGEKIVAHGKDAVQAVEEARSKGIGAPYLFYVQPPRSAGTVRIGL